MNKKDHIDKLVEETLNSFDNSNRAEPKPFLLTRIHARMNKATESAWERAGWFIGRPAVAFSGLCLLILINLSVVVFNRESEPAATAEQSVQNQADEFSYTVATIYDIENTQP